MQKIFFTILCIFTSFFSSSCRNFIYRPLDTRNITVEVDSGGFYPANFNSEHQIQRVSTDGPGHNKSLLNLMTMLIEQDEHFFKVNIHIPHLFSAPIVHKANGLRPGDLANVSFTEKEEFVLLPGASTQTLQSFVYVVIEVERASSGGILSLFGGQREKIMLSSMSLKFAAE